MKKRRLTHVTLHPPEKGMWVPLPFITQIDGKYVHGYEDNRTFTKKEIADAVSEGALWEVGSLVEFDDDDHSRGAWLADDDKIYWASLDDPMVDLELKEIVLGFREEEAGPIKPACCRVVADELLFSIARSLDYEDVSGNYQTEATSLADKCILLLKILKIGFIPKEDKGFVIETLKAIKCIKGMDKYITYLELIDALLKELVEDS